MVIQKIKKLDVMNQASFSQQRLQTSNGEEKSQGRGLKTELHSALKSSNLNLIRKNYQTGDNPYLSDIQGPSPSNKLA